MTTQFAPIWDDAAVAFTTIKANATDTASAAATTLLDLQVNNVSKFTVDKFGELILTPTARTSGSDSLLNLIAPADTTRAAGVEATDINFNLARTVQFAAGNITDQRAVRIQAPTYSFASASTITNASTLSISGPPTAGTNATLTNAWALNVESGGSYLHSPIFIGNGIYPGAINLQSATYTYKLFNSWPDSFLIAENNRTLCRLFGGPNNQSGSYTAGWLMAPQMTLAWAASEPVVAQSAGDVIIARDASNTLAQRNATNSQTFRLYNTFTDASNYERLALQFGTFSSARHAQIAAESAGTGTANINLVLTPRGTGAFILGPPPDGTTVGGNARGANAVDLQTLRNNANQVASTDFSIVIGSFCRAAGILRGSYAIGYASVASGLGSTAIGDNSTASGQQSLALGSYASASGTYASALGYAFASGAYSFANGYAAYARQTASVALGYQVDANRSAMSAFANGMFSAFGDAQRAEFVLRNKTTTNAAVTLFLNGSSERLTIPSGKGLSALVILKGFKSDGSVGARFTRMVDIKNVGGTTSLETTPETYGTDYNPSECIYEITADDTNDALQLAVTGVAGETWRWVAVVYGVELAYGT